MRCIRGISLFAMPVLLVALSGCPEQGLGNTNSNTNSNDNSEDDCAPGTTSLTAPLAGTGPETGVMFFRVFADGCREFVVRVAGFAAGAHDVVVDTVVVGAITVMDDGTGELIFSSVLGNFPANFPPILLGTTGEVGMRIAGAFVEDCPAAAEVCGGGGGNGGIDNDNDMPGDDLLSFHLTIRSVHGDATTWDVRMLIGDQAVPRQDVTRGSGINFLYEGRDPMAHVRSVVPGQFVTVMAFEQPGGLTNIGGGTKSSDATYFFGFEGDEELGTELSEGVLVFHMDRDIHLTVVFDVMPLHRWGKVNEIHPEVGGGCYDISVEAATYLGYPGELDASFALTNTACATNGDIIRVGQHKPGTIVTFVARDFAPIVFNRWVGGMCGASRTCRYVVDTASDGVHHLGVFRSP